jgi:hypothetical protein
VFTKPLPSNDSLFWYDYSGFQAMEGDTDIDTSISLLLFYERYEKHSALSVV